jgi:hypothetical protein
MRTVVSCCCLTMACSQCQNINVPVVLCCYFVKIPWEREMVDVDECGVW